MEVAGLAIPLMRTLFGLNDRLDQIRHAPIDIELFKTQTDTLTGLIALFRSQYPESLQTLGPDKSKDELALAKSLFQQFSLVVRLADDATGTIVRTFLDTEGVAWQLLARCRWVFKKPMVTEARLAMVVFSTSFNLYLMLTKLEALQREVDILRAERKMLPPDLGENVYVKQYRGAGNDRVPNDVNAVLFQQVVTTERRHSRTVRQQFISMTSTRQTALITEDELESLLNVTRSIEIKAEGVIRTFQGRRRSGRRRRPRRSPSNSPDDTPKPARSNWGGPRVSVQTRQADVHSSSDLYLPSKSGAVPRQPKEHPRSKIVHVSDTLSRQAGPPEEGKFILRTRSSPRTGDEPSVPRRRSVSVPKRDLHSTGVSEPSKPSQDPGRETSEAKASSSRRKIDPMASQASGTPPSDLKQRFQAVPPFDNDADLESFARRRDKSLRATAKTDDEGDENKS